MSEPATDVPDLLDRRDVADLNDADARPTGGADPDHADAAGEIARADHVAAEDADDEELEEDDAEDPVAPGGAEVSVGQSIIHGTGVFATAAFDVDDVIERCPVLVVPPDQALEVADTVFGDYVYEWEGGYALALGFGSLYNHSRTSTARYEMDYDLDEIHVVAVSAIAPGDEITINYNGDHTDPSPVWFELDEDDEDDEN